MSVQKYVITYVDNQDNVHEMVALSEGLYSVLAAVERAWKERTAHDPTVENPFEGRKIVSYGYIIKDVDLPVVLSNNEIEPYDVDTADFINWQ